MFPPFDSLAGAAVDKRRSSTRRLPAGWRASDRPYPAPLAWITGLLLLVVPLGHAHLPEVFGRQFVLLDGEAPLAPGSCGGDPGERARLREQADALGASLALLEREHGAYSQLTVDPAGELAKLRASLCDHPAALDALRRALHAQRINDGLLNEAQLPLLRALADSYQAIGDYESAQRSLRYGFRIHGMGRGELTPAALQYALAYFQRAREIFIDPRSPQDLALFFEAYGDNRAMYEVQVAAGAPEAHPAWPARKAIALSHLRNLYLVLGTNLDRYQSGAGDAGRSGMDFMQRSQLLTFSQGRKLLEGLLDDPEAPASERAGLLLRLGNWMLWNGKWQSGCKTLEAAWAADAEGGVVRRRLYEPAELPEDLALWRSLRAADLPTRVIVRASFDVSARGDIRRIEGEQASDDGGGAGRVLRWLRDSHARPAVREGQCVDARLEDRLYRLVD
jgi:hypothetical protein